VLAVAAPASALPAGFVMERVASIPCDTRACLTQIVVHGADVYVNEREGRVRVVRNGRLDPDPVATVSTTTSGEGGLLGLAIDPNDGPRTLYVFRTLPDGSFDVVERIAGGSRRQILRMPSESGYHHGGILQFGPDGKLYVSNGESHDPERAQDPQTLGGKIYRINTDGSIPDDNPFDGSRTWSYGHRNPFGIAFDPETDFLWESENGPSGVDDEINLIEPGKNYGWPNAQGDRGAPRYVEPAKTYPRVIVPTMMAFSGDGFPPSYRGNLFMGSYGDGALRRFVLDETRRRIVREDRFVADRGVVGVAWGNGALYFTDDDTVWRVRARAAGTPTSSPTATITPTPVPSPESDGSNVGMLIAIAAAIAVAVGTGAWLLARRNAARGS
jgi:glucose/arabinose dehydrogenase